jgi:hypothetical protein
MLSPLQRVYRFVRGDGILTVSVILLGVYVFLLGPLEETRQIDRLAAEAVFAAFLVAGALFVFDPRLEQRVFVALVIATVVVRAVDREWPSAWTAATCAAVTGLAAFFLGSLFLARALRDGRINGHRIMGAVGAFLLIGVIFAQAYRLLLDFVPGAFSIAGAASEGVNVGQIPFYFSFVTLTSTGYGDIVPVHPLARSLAVLEATTGQLFLAILVARLVAMEIEWRQHQREQRLANGRARDDRVSRR